MGIEEVDVFGASTFSGHFILDTARDQIGGYNTYHLTKQESNCVVREHAEDSTRWSMWRPYENCLAATGENSFQTGAQSDRESLQRSECIDRLLSDEISEFIM